MRQLDIQLVTVGPSHAGLLRSIWLDMLAASPGVFHERLDEAMALGIGDWRARAQALSSRTATAIAAIHDDAFVGIVTGYVDNVGGEVEGQLSYLHVSGRPGAARTAVVSTLLEAFAAWLVDHEAFAMYFGVREDLVSTIDQLFHLGFVSTGTRRESELDPDYAEVELVCLLSGLASDRVLLPTRLAGRAPAPSVCCCRVV